MNRQRILLFFSITLIGFTVQAQGPGGIVPELWYKSTDDVLKEDGTTPAIDGDSVRIWTDLAGTVQNMSNTADSKPFFRSNSSDNINGYPVIDFEGNDFLETVGHTSIISGEYTKFVIYRVDAGAPNNLMSAGSPGNHAMFYENTTNLRMTHNLVNFVISDRKSVV